MGHQWYEDWFADERYLALYQHRNSEEASLALDLIEKATGITKDAAILDLACGSGRHSIALAKRGYTNITGVDLSVTLLEEAQKKAKTEGLIIHFKRQRMQNFTGRYDLIMNLFTSFGYFKRKGENADVIVHIGNSLKRNGYFILDFLNAVVLRQTLIAHDEKILSSGERVEQFREIHIGRIEKRILIHHDKGTSEFTESVRLYELKDFERMFAKAGIIIKEKFGDYYGKPFEAGSSPRLILVGKKDE